MWCSRSVMRRVLGSAVALCVLSACSLSERDLEAFRHTATGPDKLRAVLRDPSRGIDLRATAGLMLLELPQGDGRGPKALLSDVEATDAASREALVEPFAQGLANEHRGTYRHIP